MNASARHERMTARRAGACALFLALAGCASVADAPRGSESAAARPKPGPAAPVFLRGDVLGRDAAALDALLGAPALVRREGAGEFRRYALADCALIVILYPDESGAPAARHLEAAAVRAGAARPDLDDCLARGLPGGR
ncbi:hypothetical protein [Amphiplicatus metriothermophilus]|uniref:Uncharacterized protein n=1 Tax=Amphiplicatus metriothermophilus TaxID=1519374 RepID=A0A239PJP6_9PROT|nr:hypothetical protein [Amphiplicatus metriothermophilus]MBB5517635.1 hypothetical protein [Amphiplicatus metriothermophilus]SNT68031.1 hypothetical protein SAMN06297382_0527 [Amphiplicatus metriothermophilus]